VYNFTFTVHSKINNIYNCSFVIRQINGSIVNSSFGCNSSAPSAGDGGRIDKMINVTGKGQLKGAYYIETTNGTITLEGDARWYLVNITSRNYYGNLKYVLKDIILMPEWGGQCDIGFTLNETDLYCYNNDGSGERYWNQTADFSRIVFFFLVFAIICAAVNFATSYDTAYPGAMIYVMVAVVIIMNLGNGVAGPGFFYLPGATNSYYFCMGSHEYCTIARTVDNWILPVHFILLALIYFFTNNKRYQSG
jgi:hypothetical protein